MASGRCPASSRRIQISSKSQIKTLLSSLSKPVVIFLDALDQLRKPYRLGWLPDKLPTALKLVLSVLDDEAYETDSGIFRTLRQRFRQQAFLEIVPLSAKHGRTILTALEKEAGRQFQGSQRDYIITQFEKAGASPLYLKTAFEIASSWKSTDKAGEGRHVLADDTTALIAQFIAGLSVIHHHEPELVTRVLGYLTAAKDGLSAKELIEVLSRDHGVMQAVSAERHGVRTYILPPSVWARLNHQLVPFLIEKGIDEQPLLQFFHRQIAHVAREQHYEPVKAALHGTLADYFDARAIRQDARTAHDKRSLSELPYQLHHAGKNSRLNAILMSPDWMQQKLAAFGPQVLTADYDQFGSNELHHIVGRTLRLITGICTRDKRQLFPQLIGRLMTYTDPAVADLLKQARRLIAPRALLPERPSLTPPGAETARLEGHTSYIYALMVLPDGRLASGSSDRTIRLWDLTNGAEAARLEGHTGYVMALAVLPNGRLASGSDDRTIRLWDVTTGTETSRLKGHTERVVALAVLPDGRLASGSDDSTIRLWDVTTSTETSPPQRSCQTCPCARGAAGRPAGVGLL